MYDTMVTMMVFVIIFFLYLHIMDQYKTSQDLEIYEMDYTNPVYLQEVCNIRQPVLFEFRRKICPRIFNAVRMDILCDKDIKSPLVCVKDVDDYWKMETVECVPLSFNTFRTLANTDSKSHYYTDNNGLWVDETFVRNEAEKLDEFLKPDLSVYRRYDLLMGSEGCPTPLQYHNRYRRYMVVLSGKIRVKMAPWKSHKCLHVVKDYDNYEFRSKINVWTPQPSYNAEMEQIKFIEFDVHEGYVLYIPPYWWYSIQFVTSDALLLSISYDSAMSILANGLHLAKYAIQQYNIKEKITRTFEPSNGGPVKAEDPPSSEPLSNISEENTPPV